MKHFGDDFDRLDSFSREKFKKNEKRVLFKDKNQKKSALLKGTVYASMGKQFLVRSSENPLKFADCTYGATIDSKHDNSSIITVGDEVYYSVFQDTKKTGKAAGTIHKLDLRKSCFSRKTVGLGTEQVIASNADILLIVMSAAEPDYNKRLIDRFVIAAEQGMLTPVICMNKTDLGDEKQIKSDLKIYKKLGIKIFFVSAFTEYNLDKLKKFLLNKISIFAGPSGVGKSTIINKLFGTELQKINEISNKTNKGKHTTSFSKMFDLPKGGRIIDTPGIRELTLWDIGKEELPFFFHDFDNFFLSCRYLPCSHTHEPECAVLEAVEKNKIDIERYQSYLNIFETVK